MLLVNIAVQMQSEASIAEQKQSVNNYINYYVV